MHITLASIALQVAMCVTKTNSVHGRQLEPEQEHPPYCILTPYVYSPVGNIRLMYKISYTCPFKKGVFLYQKESPSFSYIMIFYIWHLTQIIKIEYSSTLLRELSDNGKDNVSLDLCLIHRRHSVLLCWLNKTKRAKGAPAFLWLLPTGM